MCPSFRGRAPVGERRAVILTVTVTVTAFKTFQTFQTFQILSRPSRDTASRRGVHKRTHFPTHSIFAMAMPNILGSPTSPSNNCPEDYANSFSPRKQSTQPSKSSDATNGLYDSTMTNFSAELEVANIREAAKAQHASETQNSEYQMPTKCLRGSDFDSDEFLDWSITCPPCPPRLRRPCHEQQPASTHDCHLPAFEMEQILDDFTSGPPRLRRPAVGQGSKSEAGDAQFKMGFDMCSRPASLRRCRASDGWPARPR